MHFKHTNNSLILHCSLYSHQKESRSSPCTVHITITISLYTVHCDHTNNSLNLLCALYIHQKRLTLNCTLYKHPYQTQCALCTVHTPIRVSFFTVHCKHSNDKLTLHCALYTHQYACHSALWIVNTPKTISLLMYNVHRPITVSIFTVHCTHTTKSLTVHCKLYTHQ